MRVLQMPANGVPWLIWNGDSSWECGACGQTGRQPPFTSVADFARFLGDVKRRHAACASLDVIPVGIGHPLNPERAER